MTEQNTAYRPDHETFTDDDPLAELARIVSGEPYNKFKETASSQPKSISPAPIVEDDGLDIDIDIEAELMRELEQADPSAEHTYAPIEATQRYSTNAPSPIEDELSLEDQLMAELSGEEFATAEVNGFAPQTAAHFPEEPTLEQPSYKETSYEEPSFEEVSAVEAVQEQHRDDFSAIDTVERVTHDLRQDLSPSFDDPEFDYPPQDQELSGYEAVESAGVGHDDELEDFFSESFADIVNSETPELESVETPVHASASTDLDLGDLDFGDAFAAELENQVRSEVVNELVEPASPSLEDHFANAFEEEVNFAVDTDTYRPASVGGNFEGMSAPRVVPAPQPELYSDANLDDFSAEDYAAAPLAASASSGRGFKLAIGALCLALVAGLGVVGWGAMSGSDLGGNDAPVVIKADSEPAKVKPESPGGKEIANQDNEVYNRVSGTQTSETAQPELISARETVSEDIKTSNRLAPQDEPVKEQSTLGISPKKVRTFTVKPDGTIIASAPAVETPEVKPANEPVASTEPTTAAVEPASSNDGSIVSIDGAKSTGEIAIPEPNPLANQVSEAVVEPVKTAETPQPAAKQVAAKPAVTKPAAAAPKVETANDANAPVQIANLQSKTDTQPVVSSSDWKVQVSSQRSRDAAETSFSNIRNRFGSVLSGRTANIEKADVDGKGTFYRVKILAQSKDEASKLCDRLKSAGGSCFVTR